MKKLNHQRKTNSPATWVITAILAISGVTLMSFAYAQSTPVGSIQGEDLCTPGQNCTPDTTPPTVSLTAPSNGITVSGSSTTVSANASDDVAVASVQFKLDGANLGSLDTTSPYSITWDTTGDSNASHTLAAVATDTSNNSTTSSSVTVTINNASFATGDINHSSTVDIFDLSLLLSSYGNNTSACTSNSSYTCDIGGSGGSPDGVVNIFDLSILLSHWGQ